MKQEISSDEAAELLNVSYAYLGMLLDSGKIRFRQAGMDRFVSTAEVIQYKLRMDSDAERAYSDLVQQAQELRMGYG